MGQTGEKTELKREQYVVYLNPPEEDWGFPPHVPIAIVMATDVLEACYRVGGYVSARPVAAATPADVAAAKAYMQRKGWTEATWEPPISERVRQLMGYGL